MKRALQISVPEYDADFPDMARAEAKKLGMSLSAYIRMAVKKEIQKNN